jgi:type II secretory pathway pseudopilin PulG
MLKTYLNPRRWTAVTLLELLAVVLIIGILSTIAVGVYTGEVRRAKIAATKDLIRQLEVAITRYEVDMGSFPPSGSGDGLIPSAGNRVNGSGFLHVALVHSMSGNIHQPASPLWKGPYISFQVSQLAPEAETFFDEPGRVNILDAFGNPIFYVQNPDYGEKNADFFGGTETFTGTAPAGSNPLLPAPNPFAGLGETYYNSAGYQLISAGPDGLSSPNEQQFWGTQVDDITNFGY